jgi:3-oxoacyl-[acyl-carrier-protein] synthase II
MNRRRVVVTGLGTVSPVGIGVAHAWESIVAARSGIARITRFDASAFPSQIAAEVKQFDVGQYLSAKDARRYDAFIHYGLVATMEAVRDAGLEGFDGDRERYGVCIGSGIGGLPMIEHTDKAYVEGGVRKISPFFVPGTIINMISGLASIQYGYKGPNLSTVSACSTANHSIGEAMRTIEYGDADVMVAGGSEACVSPLGVGGFCAARALSTRNDDPATASRPWDRDRDGFVLGEGAGVLVLEELEHARARRARIYCELTGYGMSADAHHITAPPEDGDGARRSMLNALRNAGMTPADIQYINAHGTSTPLGDVAECIAVRRTFGDHATKLTLSSTKSMTGHLLGAAGGIEAVFTVLAIRDQVAPPTANLVNVDPQCADLDLAPLAAKKMSIRGAMSNSFGFGGTNATLVFRAL